MKLLKKKLGCSRLILIENVGESKDLYAILPSIKSNFPTIFKAEVKKKTVKENCLRKMS